MGQGDWRRGEGWRELWNKLAVYRLVGVGGREGRRWAGAPLEASVAQLYREKPAVTVFRLERLSYERALAHLGREEAPRDILGRASGVALPEASLILLHAGLGMGLAEALFRPLRRRSPEADFDRVLQRFLELARSNSWPGYGRVPVESLGLMLRMFRPSLSAAVERRLRRIDPELCASFWHGAGRAVYFLPAVFLPLPGGGSRRAVALCRREPREPKNRLDALAGLAFAAAMVNLHHPRVVAGLLSEVSATPGEAEAFTVGVATALIVRRHTTPDDPAVAAFLDSEPCGDRARDIENWQRRVREPVSACLAHAYPRLLSWRRLDDLTGFQPLTSLLAGGAADKGFGPDRE